MRVSYTYLQASKCDDLRTCTYRQASKYDDDLRNHTHLQASTMTYLRA